MYKKELFEKSVAILVDSFYKGTLVHKTGCGCGVGNLVAGHLGIQINRVNGGIVWENNKPYWNYVHTYGLMIGRNMSPASFYDLGLEQIAATGYTPQDTCLLERAFESAYEADPFQDKDGYEGLMRMMDALNHIHVVPNHDGKSGKEQLTSIKDSRTPSFYGDRTGRVNEDWFLQTENAQANRYQFRDLWSERNMMSQAFGEELHRNSERQQRIHSRIMAAANMITSQGNRRVADHIQIPLGFLPGSLEMLISAPGVGRSTRMQTDREIATRMAMEGLSIFRPSVQAPMTEELVVADIN